jgi:hypothetical protein
MNTITLANLIPAPKAGDWYFVKSYSKSKNNIVITINKNGNVITDTFHGSGKGNYFYPKKISKEEAKKFLKETIHSFEKKPKTNSTDKILISCMKRFHKSFFDEEL